MLKIGEKVPDFMGVDQNGNPLGLSDFKGKKLVLYFYPKDNTSTCTTQACNLRDSLPSLKAEGYSLLGVSPDNEKSHQKFIQKFSLNFPLLADKDHVLAELFGVWQEKSMYGRKYMGVLRTTFLIDGNGVLTRIIDKVKSSEHGEQILSKALDKGK